MSQNKKIFYLIAIILLNIGIAYFSISILTTQNLSGLLLFLFFAGILLVIFGFGIMIYDITALKTDLLKLPGKLNFISMILMIVLTTLNALYFPNSIFSAFFALVILIIILDVIELMAQYTLQNKG